MILGIDKPERHAELSKCEKYRYALSRVWDASLPECAWVMLNPSTADHMKDDPTIRKCVGFARRWGCGSIYVVNLYAYRATDPSVLRRCNYPIGEILDLGPNTTVNANDTWIAEAAKCARMIVAWGGHAPAARASQVIGFIRQRRTAPIECIGTTRAGQPRHPLMVGYAVPPRPFTGVAP